LAKHSKLNAKRIVEKFSSFSVQPLAFNISLMCGILGIASNKEVSPELYNGLMILQHRGQDAAGICTYDGEMFHKKKHTGLVRDVFGKEDSKLLRGKVGIGHTRYPTWGSCTAESAQPFFSASPYGLTIASNGNIYNTEELKNEIQHRDLFMIRTTSDTEVMFGIIRTVLIRNGHKDGKFHMSHLWKAIRAVQRKCQGAYSVVMMIAGVGLIGFKDPHGIRPLMLGVRRDDGKPDEYCFASESVVMDMLGFEMVGDVENGEAVVITEGHKVERKVLYQKALRPCVFEHVYFARPDSMINDVSVHMSRFRMGQFLGKKIKKEKLKIDSVMPIPDSGREAALGCSQALGVRYREGLVKNRYVGRTFIMPDQQSRKLSIRSKLNPIKTEFQGKNVLLVEDSIVRGNTSEAIIEIVRKAGASKVYFASSSPPLRSPCMYGIDLPTKSEYIANKLTVDEIEKKIGADRLFYLELDDLEKAVKKGNPDIKRHCTACFTGEYPTGDVTEEILEGLEDNRRREIGKEVVVGERSDGS
jgi:amidophosphoribosyltransferase